MNPDQSQMDSCSRSLQISLFATGCSGIVAEFVLSTLAAYLLGNAVFQWTIVMSFMLFSMGLGSRVSRNFSVHLLDFFILTEFTLSILCAASSAVAFGFAAYTEVRSLIIYGLSLFIGFLIGMEIPLATRINSRYQGLRTNISSILEMDYFGSLLGGLVFAFVLLPFLGLTYTPIVLGSINFSVAVWLFFKFKHLIVLKKTIYSVFLSVFAALIVLSLGVEPIVRYGEQKKYKDKIIFARQTEFQRIVITQWKQWYWLYINGDEQFSTYDEERYHEPLVHPAMKIAGSCSKVLILGGGDGLAAREVLKHSQVKQITLVDIDPVITDLALNHPVLSMVNHGSMADKRVAVHNMDASAFLEMDDNLYNVIIIDLPDPDSVDLMQLYSLGFYMDLKNRLTRGGVIVTQATSPFFAKKAFLCINKTMQAAGFSTLPCHNQVPTLGQWGWILGVNQKDASPELLKKTASKLEFKDISTRFINNSAMISMIHFGKGLFDSEVSARIKVNRQSDPVLQNYYAQGSWGIY
ncbi:MAG: polyamine aminopropyltransferase [Desulfobacteraceae bacterium]